MLPQDLQVLEDLLAHLFSSIFYFPFPLQPLFKKVFFISQVDSSATVWSEKARKAIKEHDMSCLKEEKGDGKEKKKKKKE